MPRKQKKKAPPLEKQEDQYIKNLYEAAGCTVISFSQAQRAQQTAGIPDMLVFDQRSDSFWWHEVKRRQGPEYLVTSHKQTHEQVMFQLLVESFGQEYLLGAREEAWKKLQSLGRMDSPPS